MCEWVDKCASTERNIKDAPCQWLQKVMNLCTTNTKRLLDQTPTMVHSVSLKDWGISFWDFLKEWYMWERLVSR